MDADLNDCFSSTVTPAVECRLDLLPSGQTASGFSSSDGRGLCGAATSPC